MERFLHSIQDTIRILLFGALILHHSITVGQNFDSTQTKPCFKTTDLIAPSILITTGAISISGRWSDSLKNTVRDGFINWKGYKTTYCDEIIKFIPIVGYLTLDLFGAKTTTTIPTKICTGSIALVTMAGITYGLKYCITEKRPNSNEYNSFPSGHTALAFTGAELVRKEYGNYWGLGSYTIATTVAFFRLYNDEHWINDVITSAGIGILSADLAYALLPVTEKVLNKVFTQASDVSFQPIINPIEKLCAVSCTVYF